MSNISRNPLLELIDRLDVHSPRLELSQPGTKRIGGQVQRDITRATIARIPLFDVRLNLRGR